MATSLRTLLGFVSSRSIHAVYVFPANRGNSVQNGGFCCLMTVPAGVKTVKFELWGGGGDGSGACCCQWPYTQGGSGSYAERTIQTAAGVQFRICAGSSGCCNNNCCGTCGFPSFVQCNVGGTTVACGQGGCGGRALCFYKYFNCTGICEPAYNAENNCGFHGSEGFGKGTIVGISKTSNYCGQDMWDTSHGVPRYGANHRKSWDNCAIQFTRQGCNKQTSQWPGGGGIGGSACGGPCCWGGWGTGGLVTIQMFE